MITLSVMKNTENKLKKRSSLYKATLIKELGNNIITSNEKS